MKVGTISDIEQRLERDKRTGEAESDVIDVLAYYDLWDDASAWRQFGDKENNFSIIGNQQSNPAAAMVEKFVNSVDAVLMRECYLARVNPEGPEAPQSIAEAVERYFDIQNGNLANITASERSQLASSIGFVATGRKRTPNYTVFDLGEGQTPIEMPETLLSLTKSNKLRIPFVQGKFNMGGTGVLQFCGRKNFQLIVSRRHPGIANSSDASADYWGVTIVRREDPGEGRRSSMYTYLAPEGRVPRFRCDRIQIPEIGEGTQDLPALEWGTIIKMYEYEMTGLKAPIIFDFYYKTSILMPRIALPIRFFERRGYSGHTLETTLAGLHVRLEEDKRENLEVGFPTYHNLKVAGESMRASVYAFRRGKAGTYCKQREGILFTINGQTHGVLSQDFFRRRAVGMSYLADSLLVIVECDGISGRSREDLFMNSRDRLRSGDLRAAIERRLEEILKEHQVLRDLRQRRRREDVESRLADSKPLIDVLNDVLQKSPVLYKLFIEGVELSTPYKPRSARDRSNDEAFEGRQFPTYFHLRKGEENKICHINRRFRVQFETDAENDYFGREAYPGRFVFHINGQPIENETFNLLNGVATLTVRLPSYVEVGDQLHCQMWVTDDTQIEQFRNEFWRQVEGPDTRRNGKPGKRLPPAELGEGDRLLPSGLSMPQHRRVRENEWDKYGFDKYTALMVKDTGEGTYDFFVNIDNICLQSEIKALPRDADPRLLEARFEYSLILIGLAILKEGVEQDASPSCSEQQETDLLEDQVARITRAIAPVLLPMIATLGDLDLPEEAEIEDELEVAIEP
jgi:hypothetical protein